MRKVLNVNAAAANMFVGAKVRMRVRDGVVQLRPTDRVLGTNLPEGELLRAVSFKRNKNGTVGGVAVNMTNFAGEAGQAYELVKAKNGWLAMVPVAELEKGVPGARVAG